MADAGVQWPHVAPGCCVGQHSFGGPRLLSRWGNGGWGRASLKGLPRDEVFLRSQASSGTAPPETTPQSHFSSLLPAASSAALCCLSGDSFASLLRQVGWKSQKVLVLDLSSLHECRTAGRDRAHSLKRSPLPSKGLPPSSIGGPQSLCSLS